MDATQQQVVIGRDFFKKEVRDYSVPALALVREFCQNAADAGASRIYFSLAKLSDEKTLVYCANNGEAFPLVKIQDRFMQLGQSSKTLGDSSVGAFGKAKVILCFANEEYAIRGSDCYIAGEGGSYRQYEHLSRFSDAERGMAAAAIAADTSLCPVQRDWETVTAFSTVANYSVVSLARWVEWMGHHAGDEFRTEILLSWPARGCDEVDRPQRFSASLPKRRWVHKPFGKAKRYTDVPRFGGTLVVRYRGVPMFSERLHDTNDYVVVELKPAKYLGEMPLTANRDSLRYPYGGELREFMDQLYTNKVTAMPAAKDELFAKGDKVMSLGSLGGRYRKPAAITRSEPDPVVAEDAPISYADMQRQDAVEVAPDNTDRVPSTHVADSPDDAPGSHFVMRNMTSYLVPGKYDVRSPKLNKSALSLLTDWVNLLSVVHSVLQLSDVPAVQVGFVFSHDVTGLMHRRDSRTAVLINPVVPGDLTQRSIRKAGFAWTGTSSKSRLLSVATHEYLHAAGARSHDENYAAMLTEALAELWDAQRWVNRTLRTRRPASQELVIKSWKATTKLWDGFISKEGVLLNSRQ